MLDNSALIAPFCPEEDNGTFIYTEMLDRTAKKGNNNHRLVKTFYHRTRGQFWDQWPLMKELADLTKTRLYTRLAPRSWERVGKLFTQLVVEASLAGNWDHMRALYNSACGRINPVQKYWLLDIDAKTELTEKLAQRLREEGHLVARIPSRKGEHLIINPFDSREWTSQGSWACWGEVSIHKDNPTNLYIPDDAA